MFQNFCNKDPPCDNHKFKKKKKCGRDKKKCGEKHNDFVKKKCGRDKKKPMFIVRTLFDGLFVVADVFQYLEENEM